MRKGWVAIVLVGLLMWAWRAPAPLNAPYAALARSATPAQSESTASPVSESTPATPFATNTAAPAPQPSAARAPATVTTQFARLVDGLIRPVFIGAEPRHPAQLFVIEQAGIIRVLDRESAQLRAVPLLDIGDRVGSDANEQGLLGLAFSPNFATDNTLFVNYTGKDGHTRIARFLVNSETWVADPATELQVLFVEQPYRNHNGGNLLFGPDGMLWIGLGDGGSQGDPQNRAQNPGELLGKLLRIDAMRVWPSLPV